jgi:hypothetical protein
VARLGDKNQDPFLLATAAMWQGLRALLHGRFGEVEHHAADMLRWAGDDAGFTFNHAGLLASLWWDQGHLEKLKPLLTAATEQGKGGRCQPVWDRWFTDSLSRRPPWVC